jgi:hypothetical protein
MASAPSLFPAQEAGPDEWPVMTRGINRLSGDRTARTHPALPALVSLLLLVASSAPSAFASPRVRPRFSIGLSAEAPVVKAGSSVYMKVHLTNTSNQDLDDSGSIDEMTGVDPNFLFVVRDSLGRLVPKKMYKHAELAGGHPVNRTVRPGESMSEEQDVSRLFDMSRPGQYVIQVSRRASENPSDGVVRSNRITVTLTP